MSERAPLPDVRTTVTAEPKPAAPARPAEEEPKRKRERPTLAR